MRPTRRLLTLGLLAAAAACPIWNGSQDNVQPVGATSVALPLAKSVSREVESIFGDALADAYLAELLDAGAQAALFNGGSIRCEAPAFPASADEGGCAGLSIPPGAIDGQTLTDVLPFEVDDHLVVVQLTGAELKSTLERSISSLPGTASGWFMQVANLSYTVDCSQTAQVINQSYPSVLSVVTEGSRVTAISVAGAPVEMTDGGVTYGIVTNSFEAEGDDGHVAMALACAAQNCQPFDPGATDYVEIGRYLSENSPLTAVSILGGDGGAAPGSRIVLAANCMAP